MRVLQLHNQHRAHGGADDVMDQDCRLLQGAGHLVEQYTVGPAPDGAGFRSAVLAVWNRAAYSDVSERIQAIDADVVHVHTPFPIMSPAVFRAAFSLGRPTVTTVHSYRYSCIAGTCLRDGHTCQDCIGTVAKLPGLRHRCYHGSVAASAALTASLALHHRTGTFSRVDRFIALTSFAAELLARDGIPADHIVVKPNAVDDPGHVSPRSGPLSYAVYIGRLVPEKGINTLLRAWAQLDGALPLKVAGDGPLRGLVEDAATSPHVQWLGWLSEGEVQRVLAGAELLVLPSEWYEAQPLVMLRALAAGRPVLCSDLENLREVVVPAGAGSAFPTGSPEGLTRVVRSLVANPERLRQMGKQARRLYELRHTPQASLTALERTYAEVSAGRQRRSKSTLPEGRPS